MKKENLEPCSIIPYWLVKYQVILNQSCEIFDWTEGFTIMIYKHLKRANINLTKIQLDRGKTGNYIWI